MNAEFKPFRSWEVKEGHQVRTRPLIAQGMELIMHHALQIHDVQFSLSGDSFLVANGSNQAKLFDRNGIELSVLLSCIVVIPC